MAPPFLIQIDEYVVSFNMKIRPQNEKKNVHQDQDLCFKHNMPWKSKVVVSGGECTVNFEQMYAVRAVCWATDVFFNCGIR